MSTALKTRHLAIDDGPNLERLTDAAKYLNDRSVRIPIHFQVNGDEKLVCVRVTSVEPTSGSGQPTIVAGYMLTDRSLFTGHYDALTRSGYLDVTVR